MLQRTKKFWTESGIVTKTISVCTLIITLGGAVAVAGGWASGPVEYYLTNKLDSLNYVKKDSVKTEIDTLKNTLVTKAEFKLLSDSVLETKTKVNLIYDLLVKGKN